MRLLSGMHHLEKTVDSHNCERRRIRVIFCITLMRRLDRFLKLELIRLEICLACQSKSFANHRLRCALPQP